MPKHIVAKRLKIKVKEKKPLKFLKRNTTEKMIMTANFLSETGGWRKVEWCLLSGKRNELSV